uniref:Uncharacterized protein n=1 Tax=Oryza barthii TaxID=65489 RepID=A0A0D3F1U4_9ORYZ
GRSTPRLAGAPPEGTVPASATPAAPPSSPSNTPLLTHTTPLAGGVSSPSPQHWHATGKLIINASSPRNAITQEAAAKKTRIELGGEELQGTYHVDLGAELLDDVGATAEVVEDAAGDEQHHRRRDAVAHGAQKPKHHQRHVRRVRVHEHCHERREHRPRLRLAGAAVAASHGRRRRVLSYSLVAI